MALGDPKPLPFRHLKPGRPMRLVGAFYAPCPGPIALGLNEHDELICADCEERIVPEQSDGEETSSRVGVGVDRAVGGGASDPGPEASDRLREPGDRSVPPPARLDGSAEGS